ncbi:hypothetical protein [Endozoicomonas elysicola]|uniref:hypothetical protein n=1 Tax=Endozoicomonas elysicola TaxID=305900 RepID=UPI000524F814|nr:hypothetical protein [Endozoicomonas elysicola]
MRKKQTRIALLEDTKDCEKYYALGLSANQQFYSERQHSTGIFIAKGSIKLYDPNEGCFEIDSTDYNEFFSQWLSNSITPYGGREFIALKKNTNSFT